MNFRAALVVLSLLLVSLASAQGQSTWSYCSGTGAGALAVSSVSLNPDPPVLGTNDIVTLVGTVNQTVSGGTIDLTIAYYGISVFSGTYNICDSNPCPYSPGSLTASITVLGTSLPPVAPPGNYVATATVNDQNGSTLACVTVDFTLS